MKNHVTAHTRSHNFNHATLKRNELTYITTPPLTTANNLPIQVSIIVPSTENDAKGKSHNLKNPQFQQRIEQERKYFSNLFGGDTSIRDAGGYWMGDKYISEPGAIVESSMSTQKYNQIKEQIAKHAMQRQKDWKQDTILISVEGRKFITPYKNYIDDDKTLKNKQIPVT